MTMLPCPLPAVEEALSPYIHTRQDTLRIRRTLTAFLHSRLERSDGQTSHLSLTCSSSDLEIKADEISTKLTGLRKRYLEALQANAAARRQCEALKEELDDLRRKNAIYDEEVKSSVRQSTAMREYTTLLRQRRQHKKLEIIQDILAKILDKNPNPTQMDLTEVLKTKLGEPPLPPANSIDRDDSDAEAEELTFRLKKEVLEAKRSMDNASALCAEAEKHTDGTPTASVEAQVYALRRARDHLISWVEGQLAKIPEDGDEQPQETPKLSAHEWSPETTAERIKEFYARYLTSRTSLVAAVDAAQGAADFNPSIAAPASSSSVNAFNTSPVKEPSSTWALLPHILSLLQASRDEISLMQQTTYLRRQLAMASEETGKIIERLADESHLVTPGVSDMAAWANAAEADSASTNAFVKEQIQEGEEHIAAAKGILAELGARKGDFRSLAGIL